MASANAAVESSAAPSHSRGQRAFLNLYDMPELLPGAQPSANPTQREQFEERCRELHQEEQAGMRAEAAEARAAAGVGSKTNIKELEAMFPGLDPALVRAIRADASSAQDAIDTLLKLSVACFDEANPAAEEQGASVSLPPVDVGIEDHEKFPSLVDADGWQVGTSKQFEVVCANDDEKELGSAWRDRAKVAATLPAPSKAQTAWTGARQAQRKKCKEGGEKRDDDDAEQERDQPLTDYEFRHKAGQRRARRKAQFGRAGPAGGARGAGRPGGHAGDAGSSDSETESSEGADEPAS